MPVDTKTFIRQKSYASRFGQQKERLKFAIHLNFHMTTKRHLYLTHSIRVVFSPAKEIDEKLKITHSGPQNPKYAAAGNHNATDGISEVFPSANNLSFLDSTNWPSHSGSFPIENEIHNGR